MSNPLQQFSLHRIIPIEFAGYDISFTNSSLFMIIAVSLACIILLVTSKKKLIIPSKTQAFAEIFYDFISSMVSVNLGKKGEKFLPLILSIFLFILFSNLIGILPYAFTTTSHIIVNFVLAMIIFTVIILTGLILHGFKFFSLFLPKGTPWWLVPLMIIIEIFSFLAKPFSLSLRLTANMIAGHVLLKVMAGFIVSLWILAKILPIVFVTVLIGFEIFVAILQAYIFTILSCVYLQDAIDLH